MKLIDKSALVAEIEKLMENYSKCQTRIDYEKGLKEGRLIGYKDALCKINSLEVKDVDLEGNDVMNTEVDDSNISCDSTFCSAHTTCKYFNPEKESNVKHCFGGVPMQLKQRRVYGKEVDLDKECSQYFEGWTVQEDLGLTKSDGWSCIVKDLYVVAKHFFDWS